MIRGLYTAGNGLLALRTAEDVSANNLANVNSTGYRQDTTIFKEFPKMLLHRINDDLVTVGGHTVDLAPKVGAVGTGVEVNDVVPNFRQGEYKKTGNTFDFALQEQGSRKGNAFFTVQNDRGQIFYTRAGHFTMDKQGFLKDQNGAKVLDENMKPILLEQDNFRFNDEGDVIRNKQYFGEGINNFEKPEVYAKFRVVRFPLATGLKKYGYTYFRQTKGSGKPTALGPDDVKIRNGFLESSNVNMVREMVNLIQIHRSFEYNSKVVTTEDQMLNQAFSRVARPR